MSHADDPVVVTFFARCPDPIFAPAGHWFVVPVSEALNGFPDFVDEEGRVIASGREMYVAIRFHHTLEARVGGTFDKTIKAAQNAVPGAFARVADSDISEVEGDAPATYAEMVTPVATRVGAGWTTVRPEGQPMADGLTRSLESLESLVDAYRYASGSVILPATVGRVGHTVLCNTARAVPGSTGWAGPGEVVLNSMAIAQQPLARPTLNDEELARMRTYLLGHSAVHPMASVIQLQMDATASLEVVNDRRAAVLLYYTASEVLLDQTLLCMCWEDAIGIEDVAQLFNVPLMTRVRSFYHPRIGGNWHTKGAGSVVARWQSDLVKARHFVAHAGALPTMDQAYAAQQSHVALRTHLFNRLLASVNRYPKTVGFFVGRGGAERRGQVTRKMEAALASGTVEEIGQFMKWRERVLEVRSTA